MIKESEEATSIDSLLDKARQKSKEKEAEFQDQTKTSETMQFLEEDKWYSLGNAKERGLSPTNEPQKKDFLPLPIKNNTKWE